MFVFGQYIHYYFLGHKYHVFGINQPANLGKKKVDEFQEKVFQQQFEKFIVFFIFPALFFLSFRNIWLNSKKGEEKRWLWLPFLYYGEQK